MRGKKIGIILFVLMMAIAVTGCQFNGPIETDAAVIPQPEEKPIPEPTTITLLAAGDNLIHNTIYQQANRRANGNGYDFSFAYEKIRDYVEGADISFINQETPLATAIAPPASYPLFNSPIEVGDEMIALGFDVINHSNNHMLDQGAKGLAATMDYWQSKNDILLTGVYRNDSDLQQVQKIETEGITIGFIGVTYGTNGMRLPKSSELKYITFDQQELLEEKIVQAKNECDLVVVSAHWGSENTYLPTEQQKQWAKDMADWGADLILGHHSHTIQPIEYIERVGEEPAVVIYSLGNFISAQKGLENMIGGMLEVEITKDYSMEDTIITEVNFIPTITHYDRGFKDIRIYPFSEYTEELANRHGIHKYHKGFSHQYIEEKLNEIIGPFWNKEK